MTESTDNPQDKPGTAPEPQPVEAPAAQAPPAAEAPPAAAAAEKPKPKPTPPARDLPSEDDIAAWVQGVDVPTLVHLFQPLPIMKLDGLVAQIKKAEILPQHWSLIRNHQVEDESVFEGIGAVRRLREHYRDPELAERRVEALRQGWLQLGGRQPSLMNASDVFAALRRFNDKKIDVDLHDYLSAIRDVWKGLTVPHGKEQLEVLWAAIAFIRGKTKK